MKLGFEKEERVIVRVLDQKENRGEEQERGFAEDDSLKNLVL